MTKTIDMSDMRHLNLFEKITHVRTRFCFDYNNMIVFCVSKFSLRESLGNNNENLNKIGSILKKKIRILAIPKSIDDAQIFIEKIIAPATFKDIKITDEEIIVNAGGVQNKANLFGRGKIRYLQMKKIIRDFFDREYKIA